MTENEILTGVKQARAAFRDMADQVRPADGEPATWWGDLDTIDAAFGALVGKLEGVLVHTAEAEVDARRDAEVAAQMETDAEAQAPTPAELPTADQTEPAPEPQPA